MVASSAAAQTTQFINVLTGGQSGVYYPVGVALPQIDAKETPNARSTVQVIQDSAVNLNLLQSGHGEATFTLADALSDAWLGNEEAGFKQKLDRRPLSDFRYATNDTLRLDGAYAPLSEWLPAPTTPHGGVVRLRACRAKLSDRHVIDIDPP